MPRHIFVDEALAQRAYEDTSLPIGFNQTLSQPFIVALMTQILLEVKPRVVLEVGTGSGYQTAFYQSFVISYTASREFRPSQEGSATPSHLSIEM